jgi:DMSO/TMAO reductase YedYZ molybdopterin-dependent catalytic subunit
MNPSGNHPPHLTRRQFAGNAAFAAAAAAFSSAASAPARAEGQPPAPRPFLTPDDEFYDVSRGKPKPHTLTGEALIQAKLTPETWRLEVVADPFTSDTVKEPASAAKQLTLADGTALDLAALMELGRKHSVRYVKAMQCLNIAEPLGQGLWEGVPLREVLRLCGTLRNVRRVYYHGFHNNDPSQIFQSSLSYTEAMETPPGDPPVFLAYRLNGAPLSLERGGPVRLVVPWAHGFKSIKWLQRISLTNNYQCNDTYALQNNDPDAPLKTAAYIDKASSKFPAGQPVFMTGQVISGLSGLERVEYWLHRVEPGAPPVVQDDSTYQAAQWLPCSLEEPPANWSAVLPRGVAPADIAGFDKTTGKPLSWPLRYSMISWSATLKNLTPGAYEFRARAVDLNGFAQPEPRPIPKAGKNGVEMHAFEVA